MTTKEIILEQMAACHNKKNWFVPLSDALAGLSAEQAAWHDDSSNHSIWQLVNHLIFWNERWLNRFKGMEQPKMDGNNSSTFNLGLHSGSDADWLAEVKKLDEVLTKWRYELTEAEEQKLQGEAFKGFGDTWYSVLTQITIHNAYHIGQIVTIRKEQGSWNADSGVK